MSDIVIRVENLGKMYRIGRAQQRHDTMRDAIVGGLQRLTFKRPNVQRSDDLFWALKDVSFEVRRGEVVGIIGRNGAGKSTLLKILSHITEPTEGRAEIHGRVGSLLEVGTGFHPELTGRENIYLNGAILGMRRTEINRKFDEIVAFAEIERFLDTPVKRYSSGMYVRLAFAVAAHLEPEILLVDEVLAVGDAAFQKKCLGKMGEVAQEGRTVLFVSHNMAAVNRLCNTGLLLQAGRLIFKGDTREAVSEYLSDGDLAIGLVRGSWTDSEIAVIREVGILDAKNEFSVSVRAEDEFFIWIICEIRQRLDNAQIALAVLSVDGIPVFVSTHADTRSANDLCLQPGKYKAKVRIPSRFLNVGTYTLNIRVIGRAIGEGRCSHAKAFHVLQFRVEETGSVASRLNDRRQGFVTPVFDWEFL